MIGRLLLPLCALSAFAWAGLIVLLIDSYTARILLVAIVAWLVVELLALEAES